MNQAEELRVEPTVPTLSKMVQHETLFTRLEKINPQKPSTWQSATAPVVEGGNPHSYGLRPEGAYIVDLEEDRIIPFVLDDLTKLSAVKIEGQPLNDFLGEDVTERFTYMAIAASASPGGLCAKKRRGDAQGKYVILPSWTKNIDIVFGNLARAVYGIAVPAASVGTNVRTNVVLMNAEQAKGMDASEFASGNYVVSSFEPVPGKPGSNVRVIGPGGGIIGTVRALGYEGNESCFKSGHGLIAFKTIPVQERRLVQSGQEEYFNALGSAIDLYTEGMQFRSNGQAFLFKPKDGEDFYRQARTLRENPATEKIAGHLVKQLKRVMKKKGATETVTLDSLGLERVLDPYERKNGQIIIGNGVAIQKEYNPTDLYRRHVWAEQVK